MADIFNIAGQIHSTSEEGTAVIATEVKDERMNKKQNVINQNVDEQLNTPSTGLEDRVHTLEQQASAGGEIEIENTPQGVVSGSGKVTTANAVRGAIDMATAYFECSTAGATAAKVISGAGVAGFVLPSVGGSIKIKMTNRNTAASGVTLNINSTGAKSIYYNGASVNAGNTWDDNEIIELFFDGTKYLAYNVAGNSGDGVFDISAYNLTEGSPTPYADLAAALGTNGANVPQSLRKGGMSVKFIQQLYTVTKSTSSTEPSGTEITNDPGIGSGTYTAAQLSAFNTLPSGSTSVVYYMEVDSSYVVWSIAQSSDNKYVQARCMAQNFTTDVTQWQGVDSTPIAGSKNLVESRGVWNELYRIENESIDISYILGVTTKRDNSTILSGLANSYKIGYIYIPLEIKYESIKLTTLDAINYYYIQVIGISSVIPAAGTSYTELDYNHFTKSDATVEKTIPITDSMKGKYLIFSTHTNCNPTAIGYYSVNHLAQLENEVHDVAQNIDELTSDVSGMTVAINEKVSSVIKELNGDDFTFNGYVRSKDGAYFASGGDFYATDFISIDALNTILKTTYLLYNSQYVYAIAFYQENRSDSFISGITNIGVSPESGYNMYPENIPPTAKYVRFSLYQTKSNASVDLIINNPQEGIMNGFLVPEVKETADFAKNLAIENSNKLITEKTLVAGLQDQTYYTAAYGQYGIGEYTRPAQSEFAFNSLTMRGVNCATNSEFDYKIYLLAADSTLESKGYAPHDKKLSELSVTLIKEGTLSKKGNGAQDYEIGLDDFVVCHVGEQVLCLLAGNNKIYIDGTNNAIPEPSLTVNATLLSVSQNSNIWTEKWYSGYRSYCSKSLWLYKVPVYAPTSDVKYAIENIENKIDNLFKVNLDIIIPDIVYAVVGTELNLWNDTISLSMDKGLYSPMNYQIKWSCNKGTITDRCFRFTPSDGDIGNIFCTCYLYDMRGVLVSSKTFTIKVLAKNALSSSKKIVYFGDSLGADSATALYQNFNDSNKFTGTAPTMLGTRGTTNKYEAVGGYTWANYATSGEIAYRVSVSNITNVGLFSVYSDGSHNFEVIEVNLSNGEGNLLLRKHYTSYGAMTLPSGTLTRVSGSGDNSIPYTDGFEESGNPLWNDTTQQLDITQYKEMIGLQQEDKIDAVSFQFGVNEAARSELDNILTHIDSLYHCFVDDNPNCKFIIGLNTTSGNDVNGAGNNYGASFNTISYLENSYKIRQLYLTLQNNADYPNIRIAPIGLEVDRYYGYAFSTRQISQRYTENEQYHNNYVHPGLSGYGQMGDAYFAMYTGVLTE